MRNEGPGVAHVFNSSAQEAETTWIELEDSLV